MWESTTVMTIFDILIVLFCLVAIFKCISYVQSHKRSDTNTNEAMLGLSMIIVGLCSVGLFYLFDLIVMHVSPLYLSKMEAMEIMENMHLNHKWYVSLFSVTVMTFGISITVKGLLSDLNLLNITIVGARTTNENLKKMINERDYALESLQHEVNVRNEVEERMNLALDVAHGGVWDWNLVTGEVYFGPRWFSMLGYAPGEIPAHVSSWETLIHPDDLSNVRKNLDDHLNGDTPIYEVENRLKTKSGKYIWNLDRGKVISRDSEGKALRMIGIDTDITEFKLKEDTIRLQSEITANIAEGIFLIQANDGVIIYANRKFEEMFGYDSGELIGKHVSVLNTPGDKSPEETAEEIISALRKDGEWRGEVHNIKKNGTPFWNAVTVSTFQHAEYGTIWVSIHTDISDRKKAAEFQRLTKVVFDNTTEGMMVTDADVKIISINAAFTEITGYAIEEVVGKNPRLLKSGLHDKAFYEEMWDSIVKKGHWRGEIWDRRKNGEVYPKWLSITAIKGEDGKVVQYSSLFTDITDRKVTEETLHFQAYYDPLTALPNRRLLKDRLEQALNHAKRSERKVGVLFVDLNRFKHANDTFGHLAGDNILKQAGHRLLASVRNADTVCRSGSDEFLVVLPDIGEQNEATLVANKIIDKMSPPFHIDEREVYLGASIGITIAPDDGEEIDSLLKNADLAMYKAKSVGQNRFYFFNEAMDRTAKERALLEWDLRKALNNEELLVYYQPIIDLRSLKTIALEALLRWNHPQHGFIPPGRFIPIAEETGLIKDVGDYVLHAACCQVMLWRKADGFDGKISVNMSSRQFAFSDFLSPITSALHESGLPPESLIVEVTESLTLDPADRGIEKLHALKELGINIAIDDFGTGYSSLSYLSQLPIDRLKIDKSFIHNVFLDTQKKPLVEAMIKMGQSMKMQIIAEGIEQEEDLTCLQEMGCDAAQGYFFSKPVSVEDYSAVLKKQKRL